MAQFYIEALGSEFTNSGRNPISQSQMQFPDFNGRDGWMNGWLDGKLLDILSITPLLQHSITPFQALKVMGDIK